MSSSGEGTENKNYLLTFDYHFLCIGSFVYIISDIWSSQESLLEARNPKPYTACHCINLTSCFCFLIVGQRKKKGFLSKGTLLTQPLEEWGGGLWKAPEPEPPRQNSMGTLYLVTFRSIMANLKHNKSREQWTTMYWSPRFKKINRLTATFPSIVSLPLHSPSPLIDCFEANPHYHQIFGQCSNFPQTYI